MIVENQNTKKMEADAVNTVFAFLAMIMMGYFFDWQAKDLIWGLWLSSLIVGMVYFIAQFLVWPLIKASNRKAAVGALLAGLFSLVFFTIHFGGFHFVHSVFVNLFFPLADVEGPSVALYETVVKTYWPVALISIWMQKDLFLTIKDTDGKKRDPGAVYKNVVKMHLLIFVLAGFAALQMDSFVVYVVVCVFYFFPFQALALRKKKENKKKKGR